uniref:Putative secreted protein n=1 Tax=Ixodes ricinus TaxID=34613 RepID=A0A0K8RFW0_IXORI
MRSFISSLLCASLYFLVLQGKISDASKKVRNGTCNFPDQPVVTIGYLLYNFGFTTEGKPDADFEEWLEIIRKRAKSRLQYHFISIKLENTNVTQLHKNMSSKLSDWTSGDPTINPYDVLAHIRKDLMGKDNPDIVCLVTKVPLTGYTYGFGSYEPLCGNAVPMFLTYNKTNVNDTGDHFGQLIVNSMNIFNFHTWWKLPEEKKNQYFYNCTVQRFKREWF